MSKKAPPRIADLPASLRREVAPEAPPPERPINVPRTHWVEHECPECGVLFDAPPFPLLLCGANCQAIVREREAEPEVVPFPATVYESIWERDSEGEVIGPMPVEKRVPLVAEVRAIHERNQAQTDAANKAFDEQFRKSMEVEW